MILRFKLHFLDISQTNINYSFFVYIFYFYSFFVFKMQTYIEIVFISQTQPNRQSGTHAQATILLYFTHAHKKGLFYADKNIKKRIMRENPLFAEKFAVGSEFNRRKRAINTLFKPNRRKNVDFYGK